MTQRSRWAFSRFARVASALAAVVLLGAGSLLAQGETGKIEGTVKDSAGAPVGGAQVLIVGSAFHATTDEAGYYFMNNVPAGVVIVRAQQLGYAPNEVRNVHVLAGQTMTVNPVLQKRAIELGTITITEEQNPIVPRDQVASKPIVEGQTIQDLPVDAVSQVLRLQPGVVEGNRGISIRGSRPGSQATYIDGVLVKNFNGGFGGGSGGSSSNTTSATTVGTNALEEASVTTGAVGASYGEAEGGVVNEVTRAGGTSYHGAITYATDNVSGQLYGAGLNRVEASIGGPIISNFTFYLATTLQGQQNGLRPLGAGGVPQFVLGGAADSVMVPLQPFLPGTKTANPLSDSQLVVVPHFVQYSSSGGCSFAAPSQPFSLGGDLSANPRTLSASEKGTCQSGRLANSTSDQAGFDGKLQYTFGSGSRVSATYHLDRNQGLSGYPSYDPLEQGGTYNFSQAVIGNWTQTLSSSSEHALSLEAALSWQRDQFISGTVDPSWMASHQDPFAWFNASSIHFLENFQSFPITDQLIQNLRIGNCSASVICVPYFQRNDLAGAGAYRVNPYGVTSSTFNSLGLGTGGPRMQQETRVTGRGLVDWQADRYDRFQAGFDFTNFTDLAFTSGLTSPAFMSAYKDSPKLYGLFATDRIDLGDLVIELGLRYNHMNTGILYPRVPGRAFTDPIKLATIADSTKLKYYSYNAQDSAMSRACDAAIAANAAKPGSGNAALATCNFFAATPQDILSPSLGVSFPVTDRTGFRLSYSHQVETPDMSVLASGSNSDISNSNSNDIFARPVGFGKTIQFEFGVRHAFSDDMVLDIAAYNKDLVSEGAGRTVNIYDPVIGGTGSDPTQTNAAYNLYTSADFGNVRGVDMRLDRRFGSIFQGTISYTFQTAKNTGSDPLAYLNTLARSNSAVTGARIPPPQAILTSSDNRTHTIAGNLAATFPAGWHSGTLLGTILENGGIYATFRAASGLPYTLMLNQGGGSLAPGNSFGLVATPLEPINNSTMPWIKDVDLRLTRGFSVAGKNISVFADFRNLFNWKNLNNLFAETGDVVNQTYENILLQPQKDQLKADAGALWVTRQVTVNGVLQSQTGVDLTDCSKYPYTNVGANGTPDCLLLRQDEARYGNGDNFFDSNEINNAFSAFYNRYHGPYTMYGNGFNMRLGFEFTF